MLPVEGLKTVQKAKGCVGLADREPSCLSVQLSAAQANIFPLVLLFPTSARQGTGIGFPPIHLHLEFLFSYYYLQLHSQKMCQESWVMYVLLDQTH